MARRKLAATPTVLSISKRQSLQEDTLIHLRGELLLRGTGLV